MWLNPKFPADLVTFTEELLNEKFDFCAVKDFNPSGTSSIFFHIILESYNNWNLIWENRMKLK